MHKHPDSQPPRSWLIAAVALFRRFARHMVVATLLVLVPLVLWYMRGADAWLTLIVVAEGCVVLGVLWHRYALAWFGPLFFFDLVRLARQGRNQLLRVLYGMLIFAAIWFSFAMHMPNQNLFDDPFAPGPLVTHAERQRFATQFALTVLAVQGVAVVLLTPAYLASAIAEEKEGRTLEMLFTTQLTDRDIVVGKLLSRILHLGMIFLTSLPVVLFVQFWGGVPLPFILAGYATCALSLLSIGSVSILCSVHSRQVFTALIATYVIILPVSVLGMFCLITSPVSFVMVLERNIEGGALSNALLGTGAFRPTTIAPLDLFKLYALTHGVIALVCTWLAVGHLRTAALAAVPRKRPPRPQPRRPQPMPQSSAASTWPTHPITDQPLLWKEMYHQAQPIFWNWDMRILYLIVAAILGLVVSVPWLFIQLSYVFEYPEPAATNVANLKASLGQGLNGAARMFTAALAGGWCFLVAMRTAGTITREREQRTLGNLLLLSIPRWYMLWVKWYGNIVRYRIFGACLLAVWTVGVLSGVLHPLGGLLLVVACTIHLCFLANLAVWISMASRKSLMAYVAMVLMLLVVFVGWYVALMYAEFFFRVRVGGTSWWNSFIEIGLNPARTWWYLGFGWGERTRELSSWSAFVSGRLSALLAGLGVFAGLTVLMWTTSYVMFCREEPTNIQ